jgi:4a-hydroxytetrahydrobiopterin dehydratase
MPAVERKLGRTEASDAVGSLGWRFVLGTLRTSVLVGSLAEGAELVRRAIATCGESADQHLRADLRPEQAILTLQTLPDASVTARDVELAHRISEVVQAAGRRTSPESVQLLEIAIDALDIAAIRPFWKAILGYVDEAGADGPEDPLVDPIGQSPAIWFQQMDGPRPQRNRIHFDISVPHDEASARIEAALSAGGRLLSAAARAPAFWVLADAEGNEACITTWQGRGD